MTAAAYRSIPEVGNPRTDWSTDFAIVRAATHIGGASMSNEMRNIYATEISAVLNDIDNGFTTASTRMFTEGQLELVWFVTGVQSLSALKAELASLAGDWDQDGIMVYSAGGAEYVQPAQDIDEWLDAIRSAVAS